MEIATIVETMTTLGPELIVLFLVLIGLYNKETLIAARRMLRADPAGKALKIVEKADVDELTRVIDSLYEQVRIQDARMEAATPEQKNKIYDGVEAAVKKKSLDK